MYDISSLRVNDDVSYGARSLCGSAGMVQTGGNRGIR